LSAISAAVQSEIGCSARTIRFSGSEQPSDSDWKIACLAKAVVAMPTEGVRGGQGGSGGVRGSELACLAKAVVAMPTEGTPRDSRVCTSCMMHEVHEPQSARAATATWHLSAICFASAWGIGRLKVGLR
jgi:hypothetical protein